MSSLSRRKQWANRLRIFLYRECSPPKPFEWGIDMRLSAQQLCQREYGLMKAEEKEAQQNKREMNDLRLKRTPLPADPAEIAAHAQALEMVKQEILQQSQLTRIDR